MRNLAGISLELTVNQQASIEEFWYQFGSAGRAICGQPQYKNGQWKLKLGMLDEEAAEAVVAVLEKCEEPSE